LEVSASLHQYVTFSQIHDNTALSLLKDCCTSGLLFMHSDKHKISFTLVYFEWLLSSFTWHGAVDCLPQLIKCLCQAWGQRLSNEKG